MKTILIVIAVVMVTLMTPAVALAASGTSSISVTPTSLSIPAGSSGTFSYKVNLVSGSTWGTSVSASAPSGITVSFSSGLSDPPFSGTATVVVAKSVAPGTYTVQISASGDDPSSSPATVTVDVTNATVSSPPPVTPAVHVNYVPFVIGGISMALFVVFLVLFSIFFSAYAFVIRSVSFAVTAAVAVYLIAYDRVLFTSAYDHWIGLVVYLILSVVMFAISLAGSPGIKKTSLYALAAGNVLLGILMISDTIAGLPVSSLAGVTKNVGWNYLFGFGTTSISTVSISLAFTILLVFTGIYAGSSLASARSASR
ncbi:MAG: hypothetical protein OWQ34_00870 [Thermoplasma acidophilum]|nr:hypothetical protein [Thermoplasma acidophilum]